MAVHVTGLRELSKLCNTAGKQAKTLLRKELRELAEPIRRDAEQLAASQITRIGVKWPRMRVGVTQTLVYVAPRERGVKTRGPDTRRRPKFADLMAERAMDPALEKNLPNIESGVERVFENLARDWNGR